ncbi:MAG: SAM-dependent methyltransferase [Collinsella sp.]
MTQNSAHTGKLYVVGTPIGNLGDLSPRVGEAFAAADAICCEDTRVTSKLLMHRHFQAACPLRRECDRQPRHRPGRPSAGGETLAFASDAGMPSVSDPGQALVEAAREADLPVEVIPGPSACVTALVSSGIPCEHFSSRAFWAESTATACADCSALPSSPARSSSTSLHIASSRRSRPWPRSFPSAMLPSAASSPNCTRKSCVDPPPS